MYPLYQDASSVLEQAGKRKGTLSRLSLAPSIRNKKATLALAAETTRLSKLIDECMQKAELASEEKRFKPFLLKVLVYEVLFGKKKIQGGGEASRLVKGHREKLENALKDVLEKKGIKNIETLSHDNSHRPSQNLKYLRVNTLKTTMQDVVDGLLADSWEQLPYEEFMKALSIRKSKVFCLDPDFDDLLMLRSTSDFHSNKLVSSHFVRIQEKASCMPARVMMEDNDVEFALDACAAPGNKTTHLSALMGNLGKIIALDINQDRVKLLRETVDNMGANNITVMKKDFLSVSASTKPFSHIQVGRKREVGRGEALQEEKRKWMRDRRSATISLHISHMSYAPISSSLIKQDRNRRRNDLSDFVRFRRRRCYTLSASQTYDESYTAQVLTRHARCSIHQQENEDVVQSCLEAKNGDFELKRILPTWTRRGLPVFPDVVSMYVENLSDTLLPIQAEKCVRVTPEEHSMGFFVACFVRKNRSISHESLPADGKESRSSSPSTLHGKVTTSLRKRVMQALLRVYGRRAMVKLLRLMHK
eukprot:385084-Hanusia_phi.AAC.7